MDPTSLQSSELTPSPPVGEGESSFPTTLMTLQSVVNEILMSCGRIIFQSKITILN